MSEHIDRDNALQQYIVQILGAKRGTESTFDKLVDEISRNEDFVSSHFEGKQLLCMQGCWPALQALVFAGTVKEKEREVGTSSMPSLVKYYYIF